MTQLHTGRFLLRPFTAADAPSFAAAVRESMASVGQWMGWAHAAYTVEEALSWLAFCDAARAAGSAHEFGIFLDDGETLVGGAGLNQFNTLHAFCNLGYWVRASQQRQGAALAAVDALGAARLRRIEAVARRDRRRGRQPAQHRRGAQGRRRARVPGPQPPAAARQAGRCARVFAGAGTSRPGSAQLFACATARAQRAISASRRAAGICGSKRRSACHCAAISSREDQKPTASPAR
jgi:hypothetical protein